MNGIISSGIILPLTPQHFSILLPTSVRDVSTDRGVSLIYCLEFIGSLYVNWRLTYNYNDGIEILGASCICSLIFYSRAVIYRLRSGSYRSFLAAVHGCELFFIAQKSVVVFSPPFKSTTLNFKIKSTVLYNILLLYYVTYLIQSNLYTPVPTNKYVILYLINTVSIVLEFKQYSEV